MEYLGSSAKEEQQLFIMTQFLHQVSSENIGCSSFFSAGFELILIDRLWRHLVLRNLTD